MCCRYFAVGAIVFAGLLPGRGLACNEAGHVASGPIACRADEAISSSGMVGEVASSSQDALVKRLEEDPRRKDARSAFEAEAVVVRDGDSIFVRNSDGGKEEIRLFGVDAPEKDQPFGLEARQFSAKQVLDKRVTVVPFYKDKLKRTIAVVVCGDGERLEDKLVRSGLAWWYDRYDPRNTQLEMLQKDAQARRVGLWAGNNPVKPEDHRRNQFTTERWKVIDNILHMTKDGKLVPEDEYWRTEKETGKGAEKERDEGR